MSKILGKETVLIAGFLAILATPAIIQTAVELRRGEAIRALDLFRQAPTAKNLRQYEREMEEASCVAKELRPWTQYAQFRFLHDAGDKAIIGRDGWMFYKPGVRYLMNAPRRQSPAIRRTIRSRQSWAFGTNWPSGASACWSWLPPTRRAFTQRCFPAARIIARC